MLPSLSAPNLGPQTGSSLSGLVTSPLIPPNPVTSQSPSLYGGEVRQPEDAAPLEVYTSQSPSYTPSPLYARGKSVGGMRCKNPSIVEGVKTFNRYDAELLLKLLPQVVKLGNQLQSYFAVAELAMLQRVGCKAAIQGVYNQLVLLSVSHLGISNFQLCLDIMGECRRLVDVEDEVLARCYFMAETIRTSLKNHITPLIWNSYCYGPGRLAASSLGLEIINKPETAALVGWRTITSLEGSRHCANLGLNPQYKDLMVALHIYIRDCRIEAMGLLGLVLEKEKERKNSRDSRLKAGVSLVEVLFRTLGDVLPSETVELFHYWWNKVQHPYILITCVLGALEGRNETASKLVMPESEIGEDQHTTFEAIKFGEYVDESREPIIWPEYPRTMDWNPKLLDILELVSRNVPASRP